MTSEEIIQRLLDEKKITVKEAMIILKDLAKIGLKQVLPDTLIPDDWRLPDNGSGKPLPPYDVVVMYGVTTNPYTWSNNTANTVYDTSISADDAKKNDKKEEEEQ